MKILLLAMLFVAFTLTACLVPGGRHGGGVIVVPPLPSIVVIEDEPYYYQSGYHYHYRDNSWFYSNSRSGPWNPLPRDRYPKETRFKGKDRGRDRDRDHDRGDDRRDRH